MSFVGILGGILLGALIGGISGLVGIGAVLCLSSSGLSLRNVSASCARNLAGNVVIAHRVLCVQDVLQSRTRGLQARHGYFNRVRGRRLARRHVGAASLGSNPEKRICGLACRACSEAGLQSLRNERGRKYELEEDSIGHLRTLYRLFWTCGKCPDEDASCRLCPHISRWSRLKTYSWPTFGTCWLPFLQRRLKWRSSPTAQV